MQPHKLGHSRAMIDKPDAMPRLPSTSMTEGLKAFSMLHKSSGYLLTNPLPLVACTDAAPFELFTRPGAALEPHPREETVP